MLFNELNLPEEILRAVEDMGFSEATEIQSKAIPVMLEGKDLVGKSNTGTGKTAAFGIPAAVSVTRGGKNGVEVLILCPTRELAMQACKEIEKFSAYMPWVKPCAVYGGAAMDKQISELRRGANIVVGTPGRVMDHIGRKTLKLENLCTIVLDEADEMLNMGFREDIETILSFVPEERQTVLFSATMPPPIMAITKEYQNDPVVIKVESKARTVDTIEQKYFEVPMGRKTDALKLLLIAYEPKLSMVFCNTKKMVDELTEALVSKGFKAAGLHGDMKQASRTQVLSAFKSGSINVLIATDVAARGIDVEGVDCVFNYDLPQDNEYYIHRIGRTGRAGKSGAAYTIISGRKQFYELKNIASFIKADIARAELPGRDEIVARKAAHVNEKILSAVESGKYESCRADVQKLMESGLSAEDIAVALLGMRLSKDTKNIPEIISVPRDNGGKGGRYQKGGKVKLEISAGRSSRLAPNFVLGALVDATGMPGKSFGKIDIYDKFTTVEVPEADTEHVLDSMTGTKINGQKITIKRYEGRAERFEDDRDQRRGNYRDQRRKSSSRHGKGGRPKYENRRKG
ncbi:DEAD-box ATP-dependent RNA helicase CshA [uncultured Ruminococcus sp.]|uniref:DEAD/DEAH box helicase n=1 Tax=Huintestinicola butyrica TaxID=2981728 RepID=UPI000820E858|nr:DEAD/DEAH box helicase [Huintestinicola butyrica]MCU6727042.1 DEAD/DEAH box helicase [Huintestinicola butyrica]SCI68009.1 DEAD-box ATP-dependent RNA helicase CshA [uncultured Ruminococcus sp.]